MMRLVPRPLIAVAAIVAIGAAAAGCGLSADDSVTIYPANELPDALTQTTTTTTSTSTTVPQASGTDTEDDTTTTTTEPTLATAATNIYYTIGITDDMELVIRQLPAQSSIDSVIFQLESPQPDIASFGLQTALQPGLISDGGVAIERGTATVDLDPVVLDRLTDAAQRRAIAQIVLTFTSFVTPSQGAIGQVSFTVDEEPVSVFIPASSITSEPGEAVAFDDFAGLIANNPSPPTTTTTTTVATTTTTTVATTTTSAPPPEDTTGG